MSSDIPFNRPYVAPRTEDYLQEVLANRQFSGDGPLTKRCAAALEGLLGAPAMLTTSCTHAMEMAALLLELGPGDEVILPSFTFVSTVNAFVLQGARPRFVDIRPDTLNLDESLLEAAITPRTRAIFPVHYGGVGCEMDVILKLAQEHGLVVVEDAAQGIGGAYRGRALGTLGHLGALSFHETKNISCGEGGALVVNRLKYVERAEIIREKGTDRSRFIRGEVDRYGWVDKGSSYLPSELLAAFLLAQLEEADAIHGWRKAAWQRYDEGLAHALAAGALETLTIPEECSSSYHLYGVLLPNEVARNKVQARMKEQGVYTTFHYQPLHLSKMGSKWGDGAGSLPVTESAAERLLRLPMYNEITATEQERVVDVLLHALKGL
jgi:dTDP-4-amino-4,6-dideoxygalactose transaminase